ncbi:MAG: 6,7-dimethyl-8-ribityllumazine synthase [Cytophagales bacterium]|nr:MAG: 6,7-dimethyl-8-ribityllumazine synthase [Cytophagales bacterium]
MSSADKNLSSYGSVELKNPESYKISILVSEWNTQITEALYSGSLDTLIKHGFLKDNIEKIDVPGSFELSLGAQWQAQRAEIDAVICIGCVIQGDTKHFDFICDATANGIMNVGLKYNKPVVFGVLTTNNIQQAFDRAGGKHGNKGDEAAITAIKMLAIKNLNQH